MEEYSDEVHTWMCWVCRREIRSSWRVFKMHLDKCECNKVGAEHFPAEDAI